MLTFIVVKPILGLKAFKEMHLIKIINGIEAVNKDDDTDDVLSGYKDVFQGLGCLEGEHTIRLEETAVPKYTLRGKYLSC